MPAASRVPSGLKASALGSRPLPTANGEPGTGVIAPVEPSTDHSAIWPPRNPTASRSADGAERDRDGQRTGGRRLGRWQQLEPRDHSAGVADREQRDLPIVFDARQQPVVRADRDGVDIGQLSRRQRRALDAGHGKARSDRRLPADARGVPLSWTPESPLKEVFATTSFGSTSRPLRLTSTSATWVPFWVSTL